MEGMMQMLIQDAELKAGQQGQFQECSQDEQNARSYDCGDPMEDVPSPYNSSGPAFTHSGDENNQPEYHNSDGSYAGSPVQNVPRTSESPEQAKQRHAAKMQKRAATEKKCKCCGTTNTPVWRWGGDAKDTLLCNACSLRIRRSNARPQSRSKLAGDRPSKKQAVAALDVSQESGMPEFDYLSQEEVDALRQRLAVFMCHEKDRLLRLAEAPLPEPGPDVPWELPSDYIAVSLSQRGLLSMAPPVITLPEDWPQSSSAYTRDERPRQSGHWQSEILDPAQPYPEEPYWEQHPRLHDQEMAFMYAQTTM